MGWCWNMKWNKSISKGESNGSGPCTQRPDTEGMKKNKPMISWRADKEEEVSKRS